jgi:hypothetical protein
MNDERNDETAFPPTRLIFWSHMTGWKIFLTVCV